MHVSNNNGFSTVIQRSSNQSLKDRGGYVVSLFWASPVYQILVDTPIEETKQIKYYRGIQ